MGIRKTIRKYLGNPKQSTICAALQISIANRRDQVVLAEFSASDTISHVVEQSRRYIHEKTNIPLTVIAFEDLNSLRSEKLVTSYNQQQKIGAFNVILRFRSHEAEDVRSNRLEADNETLRKADEAREGTLQELQSELNVFTTNKEILYCGELAYVVDYECNRMVNGSAYAQRHHVSLGQISERLSGAQQQKQWLDFMSLWGRQWNENRILHCLRLLRNKRTDIAHPKDATMAEMKAYLVQQFPNDQQELLLFFNEVVRLFSSQRAPLQARR